MADLCIGRFRDKKPLVFNDFRMTGGPVAKTKQDQDTTCNQGGIVAGHKEWISEAERLRNVGVGVPRGRGG